MKTKWLGMVSLITLILVTLWVVPFILSIANAGPVQTFEQALAVAARLDVMFYLTYANATLFTVTGAMLFAGLYLYCNPIASEWCLVGLVFVPVYCTLNLFAYLSQITVVPRLLELQRMPEYQAVAILMLRQMLQLSPGSAVGVFNNLAYAILGIPSIIFGIVMVRQGTAAMRLAGILLGLSGVASIIGIVGVVAGDTLAGMGSGLGGILFFLALLPLTWALLRGEHLSKAPSSRQVNRNAPA
jgi:hypothetical protein